MKAGVLIAVLVLALMFGGSALAADKPTPGGGDKPKPPGGGGDKPTPGGGDKPKPGGGGKKPTPKPGQPEIPDAVIPDWFDVDGNSFYVDPYCRFVVEGDLFEPVSKGGKNIVAVEEPTLKETLENTESGVNSVYGFIDYLMNYEGYEAPELITLRVLQEGNALCADIPASQRSEGLAWWIDDFTKRIEPWVYENLGGIEFGGDNS